MRAAPGTAAKEPRSGRDENTEMPPASLRALRQRRGLAPGTTRVRDEITTQPPVPGAALGGKNSTGGGSDDVGPQRWRCGGCSPRRIHGGSGARARAATVAPRIVSSLAVRRMRLDSAWECVHPEPRQ
jgi:hypothetical protein